MNHLLPCPGCQRHVRAVDPSCPFCGEALPMSLRVARPRLPGRRLGRAATLAFGAALAAAGCGDSHEADDAATVDGGSEEDGGSVGTDSGPTLDDAGAVALYGGPIPVDAAVAFDAGPDAATPDAGSLDAGGSDGGGSDGGDPDGGALDASPMDRDGGSVALYGGPIPFDAGAVPAYGAPADAASTPIDADAGTAPT